MNIAALIARDSTSVIFNVALYQDANATTPGNGLTGLTHNTSNLSIGTITENEASGVIETVSGTDDIEAISAIGTYATPTSGKVRFGEVDSTGFPGLYQIQLENARFGVTDSRSLHVCITGAADLLDAHYFVPLDGITLADITGSYTSSGLVTQTYLDTRTLLAANYATSTIANGIADSLSNYEDGTTKIQVDVRLINNETVEGAGTSGDKWR